MQRRGPDTAHAASGIVRKGASFNPRVWWGRLRTEPLPRGTFFSPPPARKRDSLPWPGGKECLLRPHNYTRFTLWTLYCPHSTTYCAANELAQCPHLLFRCSTDPSTDSIGFSGVCAPRKLMLICTAAASCCCASWPYNLRIRRSSSHF